MDANGSPPGEPQLARRTYRIEEVAKLLGIGRNKAYEAAQRDDCPFPVIRIGKRLVVPRVAINRMLGIAE
jgi:predicted DNA-binding transcriptional regulator AlpA